jgi:hypothetical protein
MELNRHLKGCAVFSSEWWLILFYRSVKYGLLGVIGYSRASVASAEIP